MDGGWMPPATVWSSECVYVGERKSASKKNKANSPQDKRDVGLGRAMQERL